MGDGGDGGAKHQARGMLRAEVLGADRETVVTLLLRVRLPRARLQRWHEPRRLPSLSSPPFDFGTM